MVLGGSVASTVQLLSGIGTSIRAPSSSHFIPYAACRAKMCGALCAFAASSRTCSLPTGTYAHPLTGCSFRALMNFDAAWSRSVHGPLRRVRYAQKVVTGKGMLKHGATPGERRAQVYEQTRVP